MAKGNLPLELYLRTNITPKIDFRIEEFHYYGKERLVVFIIPAAIRETTNWMGIPRIRINSSVTDLRPYSDWIRQIYMTGYDWTAEIVENATLADLDLEAILKAREGYMQRNPRISWVILPSWSGNLRPKRRPPGKFSRFPLFWQPLS